jgi:hypothetical protein
MSWDKGWTIVCGVLTLVVLFNLGIALAFIRKRGGFTQDALRSLRNPWHKEDDAIAKLRKRVQALSSTEESTNEDG